MGNLRMNCVADDLHRCPLADRSSPGRTHGNAVTNPRIRVCSTVVLMALPPAPRNRSTLPQPAPANRIAPPRPGSLTTNIRVLAPDLAFQPRLRNLRGHHRRRLRRLAQAHRSARHHHLHRLPRMGPHRSRVRAVGITSLAWRGSRLFLNLRRDRPEHRAGTKFVNDV